MAKDTPVPFLALAECIGVEVRLSNNNPDPTYISISHVERQNLTKRIPIRRFARQTNGFSKKVKSLEHAVVLYFMQHNFCRHHQTLRANHLATPAAMAGVGVADHV